MATQIRAARWGTRRDAWRLGEFRLSLVIYPPGLRMPSHEDTESHLTLIVAGGVEEQADHESCDCRPGMILVKPAGVKHENRVGCDGLLALTVHCDASDEPSRADWNVGLRRYRSMQPCAIGAMLLRILTAVSRHADDDLAADIWDVLTLLDDSASRQPPHGPAWLRRVRDTIHDRAGEPLCVAELAAEFGVHPVYLARAFRRGFACSLREYIHRERALRAARLLASGETRIADVAVAAGFADQSHLCRRFRQHLGISPGEYRRLTRPTMVSFVQDAVRRLS